MNLNHNMEENFIIINKETEHKHEWKYGEPKEVIENRQMQFLVTRFCTECFKAEVKVLNVDK